MKAIKRATASVLALAMMATMAAGCGGGGESSGTVDSGSSGENTLPHDFVVTEERKKAVMDEPETIKFLYAGYDGTDTESQYYLAIQELEKTYGKKVEVMTTVGNQTWNQKVAAQVAANDPIDVFFIGVEQYLNMYQKGYLHDVDQYVDLKNEWHNTVVMDDYVKFDGKYYAACVSSTPYVLFYNKDILINAGFDADEPQKLYKEGKWDWEHFVEMARECDNKEEGIVGLENMFDEVFQASNKCRAVDFNKETNQYTLNIKSPEMRNTLEMVKDIFHTNPICGVGYVTGQNKFLKGKAAFHGAYSYEDTAFLQMKEAGDVNIDYGVTAFPVGPDNKEGYNFGHSAGYAIASGSKAPYTSGLLIDLIGKYAKEIGEKKGGHVPKERLDFYKSLSDKLYVPSYVDGVLEKGFGAFYLLWYVRLGDDINKVVSTYETNYQKMLDDANELLKK